MQLIARSTQIASTIETTQALACSVIFVNPSLVSCADFRPAPRHGRPMALPIDWVYTAVLNVMELPVTQVPMGLDDEGLPTGVQVAAIHGHDHVSIAAALALEEATGGWIWPAALADAGPAHPG